MSTKWKKKKLKNPNKLHVYEVENVHLVDCTKFHAHDVEQF